MISALFSNLNDSVALRRPLFSHRLKNSAKTSSQTALQRVCASIRAHSNASERGAESRAVCKYGPGIPSFSTITSRHLLLEHFRNTANRRQMHGERTASTKKAFAILRSHHMESCSCSSTTSQEEHRYWEEECADHSSQTAAKSSICVFLAHH